MKPKWIITSFVVLALATLTLGVLAASGQLAGTRATVPMQIPYQGILEKDGALVNAIGQDKVEFRVALFDAATDGIKLWPDALSPGYPVYENWDCHLTNVYNGRFAFNIGENKIYQHIANTPLFLEIWVKGATDNDYVKMGARQQLLATPFAIAAEQADTDFYVPGQLTVDNQITASAITTQGNILNQAANGSLGVSSDFLIRDEGDDWIRLRRADNSWAALATANIRVHGSITIGGCPAGYTFAAFNLCVTDTKRGSVGYVQASADCLNEGAHLCTMEDIHHGWSLIGPKLDLGDWIGDSVTADDTALCVNNVTNSLNIDGPCTRGLTDYRNYLCCISGGH